MCTAIRNYRLVRCPRCDAGVRMSADLIEAGLNERAGMLELYSDRDRASQEVKRLALRHVAALDAKIDQMKAIRKALAELADRCHGDNRPECRSSTSWRVQENQLRPISGTRKIRGEARSARDSERFRDAAGRGGTALKKAKVSSSSRIMTLAGRYFLHRTA